MIVSTLQSSLKLSLLIIQIIQAELVNLFNLGVLPILPVEMNTRLQGETV